MIPVNRFFSLIVLLFVCNSTSATPFDGRYYTDDNMLIQCRSDFWYPIEIKNNYLRWMEADCYLTNARKINEIDAILYFGLCMEEGDYSNKPILISPTPWQYDGKNGDAIIVIMKNRLHFNLKRCPDPTEWKKFFLNDWVKNGKKG
ncbi:hypothetical protein N8128_06790 [Paracoccaceae bacterium]|nr:hypothetical protein [Paracoccaceae bacterium]